MLYETNCLEHYGIKGQKWGTRRFQNEDGSYTPEGKERYSQSSSGKNSFSREKSPFGLAGGIGGSGKTGRMMTNTEIYLASASTSFLIRRSAYEHRRVNAKKEIAKAEINKDKERITKDNLKDMCSKYNRKERHTIIDQMKSDPDMTYKKATDKANSMRNKRKLRNTALYLASCFAIPAALLYGPKAVNNTLDSLGRNKKFQDFMEYFYAKKLKRDKNIITLREDQYEIDKKWNLPEGRG